MTSQVWSCSHGNTKGTWEHVCQMVWQQMPDDVRQSTARCTQKACRKRYDAWITNPIEQFDGTDDSSLKRLDYIWDLKEKVKDLLGACKGSHR